MEERKQVRSTGKGGKRLGTEARDEEQREARE
jgi:hypothetical protein